ncbi:hypothetical protein D3Z52_13910 [Clostridiaceae bacterium]|nr:hypothetical protein [Clostridiaceae bacterium]
MEKIHIFSDSACDIPEELVKSNGIEIIPVHITHEGRPSGNITIPRRNSIGNCSRSRRISHRPARLPPRRYSNATAAHMRAAAPTCSA